MKKRNGVRQKQNKLLVLAGIGRLLHRLIVLAAAVMYASSSINAAVAIVNVMGGSYNGQTSTTNQTTTLIGQFIGTETVRMSPIVQNVLGNSTAPVTGTIYLETNGTSTDACHFPRFQSGVYGNHFIRSSYAAIVSGTSYYFTMFQDLEIITPIVDCTFAPIKHGDREVVRVYVLLRNVSNAEDVFVVSVRFSIQDYMITKHKEKGPMAFVDFTVMNDMRVANVTSHFAGALGYPYKTPSFVALKFLGFSSDGRWTVQNIPRNASTTVVKTIQTIRRTGFYISAESIKSNVKHVRWKTQTDPVQALTQWTLARKFFVRNSWAWAHCIHFYFATDSLFNLGVLCLLVSNNLRKGKFWIGDAFVSISNTLLTRGVCIVFSWYLEGFWTLIEYCVYFGNEIYALQHVPIYQNLMHGDLLSLYLCGLTIIAYILHEKIDPALSLFVFEIAWTNRIALTKWYPSIASSLSSLAESEYALGYVSMNDVLAKITPLRVWTLHKPSNHVNAHLFPCIAPIFTTMAVLVVYALVRKFYYYLHPPALNLQNTTNLSQSEQAATLQKRTLTLFEIATGAALQDRVGIVAEYENCWFIKGMKYASADGVFSSGFVIANEKFLIATVDLATIILMKMLRLRFRNVHVFEVTGSTVKQTAQLVYPDTMTWTDLANLNLSILS